MAHGKFAITTLYGKPLDGIWKPAKKGSKHFRAAKVKEGQVPCVLQVPGGWAPERGLATARELNAGQVVVVSEDRSSFAEMFDSAEEFENAGYKYV